MWNRRVGIVKKLKVFRRRFLRTGNRQLINMGLVPARVWEHKAFGVCPTQRPMNRRQVAEMLGKKKTGVVGHLLRS